MNSDSQRSLTEWGKLRSSPDPAVRDEAASRIFVHFYDQLTSLVGKILESELRARVDAEDAVQSVLHRFLAVDGSFPNRNAMWRYLLTMALNKVASLREFHYAQIRDVHREISRESLSSDSSSRGGSDLKEGRRHAWPQPITRPYHSLLSSDEAELGSADSFFDDDIVQLLEYGARPEHTGILTELLDILRDHDETEGDCLLQIVELALEGYGTLEIAGRLSVTARTIDYKGDLIAELWEAAKPVTVRIEGATEEERVALVLLTDTALKFLKRLGLEGYRLCRETEKGPARSFEARKRIYGQVSEGDVLRATHD